MSFALTAPQFRARIKFVTRRYGWLFLCEAGGPGTRLAGVEKCMGFKKGERAPTPMGTIEIASGRREPLNAITPEDVALEGFPGQTPEWFVDMLCRKSGRRPEEPVSRIEYGYVLPDGSVLWRPAATTG